MKRVLLMHEPDAGGQARIDTLRASGFEVVDVDPFNLHWTKMIEAGSWHAIIVDQSVFELILNEIAAELAMSQGKADTTVYLLSEQAQLTLPAALQQAKIVSSVSECY